MKTKNHKNQIETVVHTELGYPVEEFKEMIEDARGSGYHYVTANDIKSAARKRNNLRES